MMVAKTIITHTVRSYQFRRALFKNLKLGRGGQDDFLFSLVKVGGPGNFEGYLQMGGLKLFPI